MERVVRSSFALALSAIILFTGTVWAGDIRVRGTWVETVDENDLVGGPGSDLNSTYESAADQITILIEGAEQGSWRGDVRKADVDWLSGLHLYVRRTSDGSGQGTISGGTTYQEVTDTYQTFFSGSKNRSGISVQEMIDGVSAGLTCDMYETTVYYLIIDTG